MLKQETLIFPGHNYGKLPGQKFSLLLKDNMYLQFKNENDFAAYRLRHVQNKLRFFISLSIAKYLITLKK